MIKLRRGLPSGFAALTAGLAGVSALGSILLGLRGLGWDPAAGMTASVLLAIGAPAAGFVGAGFWLSGLAYLLLLPAALSLAGWPSRRARWASTASGSAYLLLGAVGAIALAARWPGLIEAFETADPALRAELHSRAELLTRSVEDVFHGPLQNLLGAFWFAGIAALQRRSRGYAATTTVLAVALSATTAGTWLGIPALTATGVGATVGLTPAWAVWTGVRLRAGTPGPPRRAPPT